jgi:hypothetical protein
MKDNRGPDEATESSQPDGLNRQINQRMLILACNFVFSSFFRPNDMAKSLVHVVLIRGELESGAVRRHRCDTQKTTKQTLNFVLRL